MRVATAGVSQSRRSSNSRQRSGEFAPREQARLSRGSQPQAIELGEDDVARLWRDYKRTGDTALRDLLIIHYMTGHVRRIAQRLHAQLPKQVELDDLVNESYDGLVDVIERYDLDRDVRFETFSSQRLYGAMRDYLRNIDVLPRLTRSRSRQLQNAIDDFQKCHGRQPDTDELRASLNLPERKFRKLLSDGTAASIVCFSGARPGGDTRESDESDAMSSFEDQRGHSPLRRVEHADLRDWITQGFSRRDRLIIILYYYEQMTMREIGQTIGCSESRISQRLHSITRCLRARLRRTGAERELAE